MDLFPFIPDGVKYSFTTHTKPVSTGVAQASFITQNWSNKTQCNSWLQ